MTESDLTRLKQPPASQEAEQALIGAAMLDNDCIADLQAEGFSAEFFYWPQHKLIWAAIDAMTASNLPVDLVTLTQHMDPHSLEQSGGLAYIADVLRNTPGTSNVNSYARIVRERAVLRKWLHCAQQIQSIVYDNEITDHDQRLDAIDSLITAMGEDQRQTTRHTMNESLKLVIDGIEHKHDNPGLHGLCTGFRHLDHRLNSMLPGDLIVIAGRPAMGKTTIMTAMARNFAKANKRGMIFSLEMPHSSLTTRMIAAEGSVKLGLLKSAKVMDYNDQCEKLVSGVNKLKDLPIVFDDQGGISVQEIAARSRREFRQKKLEWIIVDHIGLVDSRRHKDRDDLNIADVTRTLKRLAKELGIVVIALSQVNRKCEERSNKRPRMSDLLGSSAIEQDADAVLTLYRDVVYNENAPHPNQLEIISAKLRDGETGIDFVEWRGEYNQVLDWPEHQMPPGNSGGRKPDDSGYE